MLKIQEFIIHNEKDFRKILSQKPYCIDIREDDDLILFKYRQTDSDFSNAIVKECRGLILYKKDWNIACHPFHKFFNFGETNASEIDWSSAKVYEKLDGSIIKLFYNKITKDWQIATNGTINAFNTSVGIGNELSFGELVFKTVREIKNVKMFEFERDIAFTYIFELCTPYNRVVVPHKDNKLYLLSIKHNDTGYEKVEDIFNEIFPRPKSYSMKSLKEVIDAANELPFSEEGYVVVDKNFNRIKVKSPAYVAVHHLSNNGVISKKRIVDLIIMNEVDEFLTYYPEYKEFVTDIRNCYDSLIEKMEVSQKIVSDFCQNTKEYTRKDLALFIKDKIKENFIHGYLFGFVDGKTKGISDFVSNMGSEKIASII